MQYDVERDPGRTHELDLTRPAQRHPEGVRRMGVLATSMTEHDALMDPQPIGGGVSLQDTIAQIATLQRAIQDQTRMIHDFVKSNTETMQLVRAQLTGSNKGYNQQMLTVLTQTEMSLRSSLAGLERASAALDRVRAI